MLDADLAIRYGVSVGRLNEAVKRNRDRFPDDFMFQLSPAEFHNLRAQLGHPNLKSQIAISSSDWGGRRHPPYAFTEQGVAMLSGVLRSKRAVRVNIEIMRAFVRLRELLSTHRELAQKLAELEHKIGIRLFATLQKRTETQILGRQLLRSRTSGERNAVRRHEPNPTPISLVKLKDRCRSWRKQTTGWNCLANPDSFRKTDGLR